MSVDCGSNDRVTLTCVLTYQLARTGVIESCTGLLLTTCLLDHYFVVAHCSLICHDSQQYNAIAKEHNQKVNWITVAKELGIHVKVREKYARMHSRAEQRGFDWEKNGDWKIKDHPEIFMEPTQAEQKAKMPPPPPHASTTVLIEGNKEVIPDEAAVAAAVVDASGAVSADPSVSQIKMEQEATEQVVDAVVPPTKEQTAAAAAVAASLVNDPTSGASLIDEAATSAATEKATETVAAEV